jgi:AcrR family transcriptional regulator
MTVALVSPVPAPVSGGMAPGSPAERIVAATLRCISRWGVGKTSLDDVAREAGVSRATVYRLFPGGRDGLFEAVARHEIARFFAAVGTRLAAADDALRAAEWVTRLVLSYASTPAGDVCIGEEASVRRLVRAFVLPGLLQHVTS